MQSSHIMVFLIVLTVFAWKMLDSYFKNRRTRQKGEVSKDAEEMMAHIDALEERIRVLEQIVTDPKENLSQTIKNL